MNQDPYQEESLDLKNIIFRYLPYWYLFALGLMLALGVAYLYNRMAEPVYQVSSTVLISDRSKGLGRGALLSEMELFSTRTGFHDQIIILQSQTMIDSVLRRMPVDVYYFSTHRILGTYRRHELYLDSPFRVVWDRNHQQPLEEPIVIRILDQDRFTIESDNSELAFPKTAYRFGENIASEQMNFVVELTEKYDAEKHQGNRFLFVMRNNSRLVGEYSGRLSVQPYNKDAWILEVSFQATHLRRAVDFVNTLTNYFIDLGLAEKNQIARNTIRFIDEQIAITTDSLFLAENSLQRFRQDRNLMDLSQMATQLMGELQALDQQKAIELVKRQYYDYLLEYLENEEDFTQVFGPSALGIEDRLLNQLLTDLSRLYAERASLLLTTTERSPLIQATDQKIELARRTLEENIRSIKGASDILMADIDRRISQVEQRIGQLPQTERELLGIQRRFNLNDATYNYLLEKRAEAGIAMASNIADNQVVDAARFREIVAPKKSRNYAIALMLGFVLPLAFLILRDFFNTRIMDKKEVTDALPFPVLGIVPHDDGASRSEEIDLVVFDNPRSHLVEAFRTMRANLQFIIPGEQSKVIVVTSTRSFEGKSFTALNLASVFALSGKKTVLMGADMRKPKLFKEFELKREPGLSNYLIGAEPLEKILQPTKQDENLFVITAGPVPPNPTELLETKAMEALLTELRLHFDYIIVDTAPVGLVPDAMALMKQADTTLYLIRQRFTDRSALDFIKELSEKTGLKNICIEINDMETGKLGARYGYGYGYGYAEEEAAVDQSLLGKWAGTFKNGKS